MSLMKYVGITLSQEWRRPWGWDTHSVSLDKSGRPRQVTKVRLLSCGITHLLNEYQVCWPGIFFGQFVKRFSVLPWDKRNFQFLLWGTFGFQTTLRWFLIHDKYEIGFMLLAVHFKLECLRPKCSCCVWLHGCRVETVLFNRILFLWLTKSKHKADPPNWMTVAVMLHWKNCRSIIIDLCCMFILRLS